MTLFTRKLGPKVYVDIRAGSLEGASKTSIFSAFRRYVFGTLENKANIII